MTTISLFVVMEKGRAKKKEAIKKYNLFFNTKVDYVK